MRSTLEILALEKRWRRWRTKQTCKYIFATLLVGTTALSCGFLFLFPEYASAIFGEKPVTTAPRVAQNAPTETPPWAQSPLAPSAKERQPEVAKKTPEKTKDAPKEKMQQSSEAPVAPKENPPAPQADAKTKKAPKETHEETKEAPPEKISIAFKTVQKETIGYLKKKFDTTQNIVFALMLAEEYLHLKSYKEALKWALVANEIDPKNERSWILFAKTKAKLNSKNEAIIVLEEYLKHHSSAKVELLVNSLKKGTL